MTLQNLKEIPVLMTSSIGAVNGDPKTHNYIVDCLHRFYAGDYGEICEEDTAANNADLAAGCGHVLARYKQFGQLTGPIYIESHFDDEFLNDINYTNTIIMYPDER